MVADLVSKGVSLHIGIGNDASINMCILLNTIGITKLILSLWLGSLFVWHDRATKQSMLVLV